MLIKTSYLNEIQPLSQTYQRGDSNPEVKKIKEWLMLWQLNQNYVSKILHLHSDGIFDVDTETVLHNIQGFLDLDKNGIVDTKTWDAMVSPMVKAFDIQSYNHTTLREKMCYFASKHLQFRASELYEDNIGPWVRAYMDNHEGTYYYWCAGFVSTILDQTFSTIEEKFTTHYANSWLVEDHRTHARKNGLLVTNAELQSAEYTPQAGDMMIVISDKDSHAHHIEIVYETLDTTSGKMRTIGGNTNFTGSRNGVGVFMVDRNFLDKDIEIIKMIDQ